MKKIVLLISFFAAFVNCFGQCSPGQILCSGVCVDVNTNPNHCGACGNTCPTGQVCVNGSCATTCPAGQVLCSGICVDISTNPNHCSTCGHACPVGQVCVNGSCATTCPAGQVLCGGICVDVNTNPNHCGACGNACPAGQVCVNGSCATSCPIGQILCSGICVDVNTNPNHCGACGNACPAGQVCVNGSCTLNSTGINVLNDNPSEIFAYPNPVYDIISIKSATLNNSKANIKLYDSRGLFIPINNELKREFSNGILTVSLPEKLTNGIYFIVIETQTFNKIVKINKQ